MIFVVDEVCCSLIQPSGLARVFHFPHSFSQLGDSFLHLARTMRGLTDSIEYSVLKNIHVIELSLIYKFGYEAWQF